MQETTLGHKYLDKNFVFREFVGDEKYYGLRTILSLSSKIETRHRPEDKDHVLKHSKIRLVRYMYEDLLEETYKLRHALYQQDFKSLSDGIDRLEDMYIKGGL